VRRTHALLQKYRLFPRIFFSAFANQSVLCHLAMPFSADHLAERDEQRPTADSDRAPDYQNFHEVWPSTESLSIHGLSLVPYPARVIIRQNSYRVENMTVLISVDLTTEASQVLKRLLMPFDLGVCTYQSRARCAEIEEAS
jgi:hypothetical protein